MDQATLQKQFGAAVRKHRTSRGFSQDSFADAIGMHRASYAAIERGERNSTLATMGRLAEGLALPISTLFVEAGL